MQPSSDLLSRLNHYLGRLSGNKDTIFAIGVCLMLSMLFIPLPSALLDLGLGLSFAASILILMVALWVNKPLEFSSFPTLLLLVTVFRLALTVASTRLILAEGHTGTDAAGAVIEGIASFAIGGDFVIGIIIFIILMVVNFIVITKGSTRIAEVSARFSLDAMQGKQMAIDNDFNAGLIDEAEAKQRRKEVEGESGFFGAMDGAAKFVRGDAVAGIIITIVNIVGGIMIGLLRQGLSVSDAMHNYTVLTIGDGLVSQIPALIISIAAAIIITKGSNEGAANEAVLSQLNASPKAIYSSAGLMVAMGLLPGFPLLLFVTLGVTLAGFGYMSQVAKKDAALKASAEQSRLNAAESKEVPEKPAELLKPDALRLELGSNLVMLISDTDAALPWQILNLRKLFANDFGFLIPAIRIKDNPRLAADTYTIYVHGVAAASGRIVPGTHMIINPTGISATFPGESSKEPTFGLDALWVDATYAALAESEGQTVVDPESVIITHLTEIIRGRMDDLMNYGTTIELIKSLDKDYQKLVSDVPHQQPAILLQNVLQNLLSERLSIRNLPLIIEAFAEAATLTKSTVMITEHVRRKICAQICADLEDENGYLPVITLGNSWTHEFASNIKVQGDEYSCVMSPKRVQEFVKSARIEINKFTSQDVYPALLVSADARPTIRAMLERVSPKTQIISHGEVHKNSKLKTLATIGD